jgi:signal transduction histidine kinase
MKLTFTLLLALTVTVHAANDRDHFPYTAVQVHKNQVNLYTIDIDQDGYDEFMEFHPAGVRQLSLRIRKNINGAAYYQSNFANAVIDQSPYAFHDENGRPVIIVPFTKGFQGFIRVIRPSDTSGKKEYRIGTGKDRNNNNHWDCSINIINHLDINQDGHDDILINLLSTYDLEPRALIAFDIYNGKILWEFALGAGLYRRAIRIGTPDNPRLLMGTGAYHNGVNVNNLTDSLSYRLQFSLDGTLYSAQSMAGPQTHTRIEDPDFDGDGKREIAVLLSSQNMEKNWPGSLSLWNENMTFKTRQYTFPSAVDELCSGDIHGDGHDDLFITSMNDSRLYVVSSKYDSVLSIDLPLSPAYITLINLRGDLKPEIVITDRYQSIVLDQTFDIIAHIPAGGPPQSIRRGFENPALLTLTSNNKTTVFRLSKTENPFILPKTAKLVLIIFFVVTLAGVYLFFCFYRRSTSIRQLEMVFKHLPTDIILIDRKQRIMAISYTLQSRLQKPKSVFMKREYKGVLPAALADRVAQILDQLENKKSDVVKADAELGQRKLEIQAIKWNTIPHAKLIFLHDVSLQTQSERTLEWAAMAQRLAHEIKNPLSIIRLTLERLQLLFEEYNPEHGDHYREQVDSIYEEIDRLRKATDGFMKLAKAEQMHFSTYPVEKLTKEIEKKYAGRLPKSVSFQIVNTKNLPRVRMDLDQMLIVFSNLIDNAVRAMQGKGKLSLETSLMQKINAGEKGRFDDFVVLELSDTGCGIAEEDVKRIFNPFFSKNAGGTGLGTAIAKRIIEEHGGEITLKSKINTGTTVRISLPVAGKEQNRDEK